MVWNKRNLRLACSSEMSCFTSTIIRRMTFLKSITCHLPANTEQWPPWAKKLLELNEWAAKKPNWLINSLATNLGILVENQDEAYLQVSSMHLSAKWAWLNKMGVEDVAYRGQVLNYQAKWRTQRNAAVTRRRRRLLNVSLSKEFSFSSSKLSIKARIFSKLLNKCSS